MAQVHCSFNSYSLMHGVDIMITLPSISASDLGPNAKPSHKINAKYPVLYLLHGHGNDYLSWYRYTSVERYAEERRIAIVTCSVENKRYMNIEALEENYFDFIKTELPEFICANFPISERWEDTYLGGLSMGGYGTLAHGLEHPESYRAIGAFSPAIKMKELKENNLIKAFDVYDLLQKDLTEHKRIPDLFLCCGKNDFLYSMVEDYHQTLLQNGVKHRYDAVDGFEHEWAFWEKELPLFLDWLPRTDIYASMERRKV